MQVGIQVIQDFMENIGFGELGDNMEKFNTTSLFLEYVQLVLI